MTSDAITATGKPALCGAGVGIDLVTIVTRFNATLRDLISATSALARIRAGIVVESIAVVTLLFTTDDSITTSCTLALV